MKLQLNNLNKNFDKKIILNDVSFAFEKGKIYGLLGRNGACKTTLFNCISEELPLDSGNVTLTNDDEISKSLDSFFIYFSF